FKPYIVAALLLIAGFHLLYPLRHHLFEGSVAWTEEGHRFSWRMMLRWKTGYGHFVVFNPADGSRQTVDPKDFLSKKQVRKLYGHPDMILQFAHFLRDRWCDLGIEEVQVYANIKTQLNGRPHQPYIDPETDLAATEWSHWKSSPRIIPLKVP
ncbi:HTTM domain-containing protein, partial [Arthrospira platensis SPKY1]|nr:HTTM domain-containing protein [Arthrospira platensis SPKY1]